MPLWTHELRGFASLPTTRPDRLSFVPSINLREATVWLPQLRRNAAAQPPRRPERMPLVPQRVDRQLGPVMIAQIVAEYVAGVPTTALALRYGIGKGRLLRLLREHDVAIRHQHRKR